MAELVDEQQFGLCEAEQLLVELLSAMRIGGAERHDGRELHRLSREDRLAAEHYGEVRWPTRFRGWRSSATRLSRICLGSSRCLKVEAGSYLAWKCASLSTISIRRWSVVIITAIQSPISRYGTE